MFIDIVCGGQALPTPYNHGFSAAVSFLLALDLRVVASVNEGSS